MRYLFSITRKVLGKIWRYGTCDRRLEDPTSGVIVLVNFNGRLESSIFLVKLLRCLNI